MSSPLPTCRFVTLGCKVNQYESQHVKEALEAGGYREAAETERADLCVVNTCTVTMEGDAKSRQWIRRLHQRNPGTRIVVMGCYATRDPEAVGKLPGVVKVITDKTRLPEEFREFGVLDWPRGIRRFDGHQRAFVKVQDGCLLHCSFCIIPSVRPKLTSRPIDDIIAEVAGLVAGGVQEIVLTGIHLGHYGIDLSQGKPRREWSRLWHLVAALDQLPGDFRVRLSSLEAAEARDPLVDALSQSQRVVPHLHLCLQSGSDRILARMNRRYRAGHFLERCLRIKDVLDVPAFSTDIIVGFPGETDADFEETCRVVRQVGFSKIHVFSYSPRQGTPAASLDQQVPAKVIDERREHLRILEREQSRRYYQRLLGRTLGVLVEGEDPHRPGHAMGTSCRYAPVSFPGYAPALVRRLVPIRVDRLQGDVLQGEPTPEEGDIPVSRRREFANRLSLPLVI